MDTSLSYLIGKGIFNPDTSFVGRVIAVRADAQNRPTFLTQLKDNTAVEIGWESIAGGKDILFLKPGFDPTKASRIHLPLTEATRKGWDVGSIPTAAKPPQGEAPTCPTCGKKATWIGEYGRWYCRDERKYL